MSETRQEGDPMPDAETTIDPQRAGHESVRAFPLLIGGLVEAGELLQGWMRGDAGEDPVAKGTVRHAAVGMMAKSVEGAGRRVGSAAKLSRGFGRLLFAPGRVVANSRPLRPVRRRFDRLVERGEAEVETWIAKGQETETQGRQMARTALDRGTQTIVAWVGGEPAVAELIDKQVARIVPELADAPQMDTAIQQLADGYIVYLSQQPPPVLQQLIRQQIQEILPELLGMQALDDLVREVADNYIAYLNEHPEKVQSLIRDQGDVYITYLTQHPEQVQTLIQGQSKGLVNEVTDEVRARTVTADSVVETLARSLLRRGERKQIATEEMAGKIGDVEENDT